MCKRIVLLKLQYFIVHQFKFDELKLMDNTSRL